jgi:formylglycine-generating enzyme
MVRPWPFIAGSAHAAVRSHSGARPAALTLLLAAAAVVGTVVAALVALFELLLLADWLVLLALVTAASPVRAFGGAADYVALPAGTLNTVLANDANSAPLAVPRFVMRVTPVTQAELQDFVIEHPQWRRDRVPRAFADAGYLRAWHSATELPSASSSQQPATDVPWFVAQAFCENEGGRLPTWTEWEYAAAADATRTDARGDPAWLARVLGWYARPASVALPDVGGPANVYGVRDLHGLIWEWVDDFNALLVDTDSRSGDDPDKLKFCGAGAINLQDKQNYAVLMRIALLSSLTAANSTSSLGFRCVRSLPVEPVSEKP